MVFGLVRVEVMVLGIETKGREGAATGGIVGTLGAVPINTCNGFHIGEEECQGRGEDARARAKRSLVASDGPRAGLTNDKNGIKRHMHFRKHFGSRYYERPTGSALGRALLSSVHLQRNG